MVIKKFNSNVGFFCVIDSKFVRVLSFVRDDKTKLFD